jgi:hypothetical protein
MTKKELELGTELLKRLNAYRAMPRKNPTITQLSTLNTQLYPFYI